MRKLKFLSLMCLAFFVCTGFTSISSAANFSKLPIWGGEITFGELCISSPTTIYAGSGYSGVFVTKNGGDSWENIVKEGANCMAVHPTMPNVVIMSNFGTTGYNKIYRSEDYGQHWTEIWGSGIEPVIQAYIQRIVPSVKTPGTFYLLGEGRSPLDGILYKSIDSGVTWTKTAFTSNGKRVNDVCIDGDDNIYITQKDQDISFGNTEQSNTVGGKFYKSADGGNSFSTLLSLNAYPDFVSYSSGVVAMTTMIYGSDHGIYISTDAFASYVKRQGQSKPAITNDGSRIYFFGPQFSYVERSTYSWTDSIVFDSSSYMTGGYILIDSLDQNTMYLVGNNSTGQGTDEGIMKSTDSAITWAPANTGLGGLLVYDGCKDPAGDIYVSGAMSVFKGTNNRTVWTKVFSPDLGRPYSSSNKSHWWCILAVPATNYVFAGSRGDLWRSTDSGNTWTLIFSTDTYNTPPGSSYSSRDCNISGLVFNSVNPAIGYLSLTQSAGQNLGICIYKTTDYGTTWARMNITGANQILAMKIDPADPTKIYVGLGIKPTYGTIVSGGLGEIIDDGTNTPALSQIGLTEWAPDMIAISTTGALIAGCIKADSSSYGGQALKIFYSINGGAAWNEVNFEESYYEGAAYYADIEYSGHLFYIAGTNGIFTSGSAAATFKQIVSADDVGNIRCLVVGSMYSGTTKGFFKITGGIEKLTTAIETPSVYGYPNPFKPSNSSDIKFKYSVPAGSNVQLASISIYNIAGELVNKIDQVETLAGGFSYLYSWDGTNKQGEACASGVYIVAFKSDIAVTKTKVAIIK